MSDIEDRLRDAFRLDAQTVQPGTIRPFAGRDANEPGTRNRGGARNRGGEQSSGPAADHRRGRLLMPIAAAIAVAAIALGTVILPRIWPGGRDAGHSGPPRPLETFLTVTTAPAVMRGDHLIRYPADALQLRALHGGRVIRTLLHSLGTLDAVMTRSGSVLAVADDGCRSQVLRINPSTGRATLIRTLAESATEIALSPDGRELAYLTYPAAEPQPCAVTTQPASPVLVHVNPGGLPHFLPSVLAVVNLATGSVARAATRSHGSPPFAPAWSPDGSMIETIYSGDNSIALLSAAHPSFASAQRLHPPHGCGYVAATWTVRGLLAVLGCGTQNAALSPRTLVRLSPAGQRSASWRLPACVAGVGLNADPAARHVLVVTDIGYGDRRPCGFPRPGGTSIRVFAIRAARLAAVAVFPQTGYQLQVTGW